MDEPISILTPTYDRKKFLDLMICNLEHFEYDKKMMDWIILDTWSFNGDVAPPLMDKIELEKVRKKLAPISISYTYIPKAMTIGQKRNWLSKKAKTKYMISMDSDDIYVPEYLRYSVGKLINHKKECCGSAQMLFMYPYKDYLTTLIICPAMRQIHEATLCYTKKHFKRMGGFSTTGFGEGGKMVDGCNESFFIKTEVASCMICICHTENSVKKDQFCTEKNKVIIDLNDGLQMHMKILKDMFRDCQEDLCCQDRVQK